ncbi:MAG: hypothetical protein R2748_04420 [Bryobacterales bacterium]
MTAFRALRHQPVSARGSGVTRLDVCERGSVRHLDHYTLPETNRRQDAIRDEIKDRPARTFLNADRQCIFYHHYFDWGKREMAPIFIYDFRLEPFPKRHIYAKRARWDESKRV